MSTSQKTSGLWGTMTKGEFEESIAALERAVVNAGGNPKQLFNLFRTDNSFTNRIAQAMLRRGFDGSTESKLARLILGRNIFTEADWMSYYDASFTKKQLRDAGKFPWGEDILNSPCPFNKGKLVKETHFAFLGVKGINGKPLTVLGWHELHPATGQPKFYFNQNPWYANEGYAKDTTLDARWYLLLKEIVPDSTDKTPEEQVAMLPAEYEVPETIVEVTKDILVFRKTDARPNPNKWARCKEETSDGFLSCVGHFDEGGLDLIRWHRFRNYDVGVGASRKFPA